MPAASDEKDRDHLFGLLALQMGFVSPVQLEEARAAVVRRPGCSVAGLLEELGHLKPFQARALEALVDAHLASDDTEATRPRAAPARGSEAVPWTTTMPTAVSGTEAMGPAPVLPAAQERYAIGGELGRGGLGRVVLALDRTLMEREVAMKLLLRPRGSSPSASAALRGRFLEEARITGQLWHPNIVPVLELGTRPDGEPYYTMPVVRGRTLKDAIADAHRRLAAREIGPEDWGVARLALLSAFEGLCNAIGYAHSRGVIHRDIKPANVMVGEYGETVVVDWGLAKVVDGAGRRDEAAVEAAAGGADRELLGAIRSLHADSGQRTAAGSITGTPAYMPPEQAAGRIDAIDRRSDVYALGAVLFEILTGQPPYGGMSLREILVKVLSPAPSPDPRDHCGDVPLPDDLADVCRKAMRKAPGERYASAMELLADVTAAIEGGKERQRRHAEAERLVASGRERAREHAELRDELARLQEAAKDERRKLTGAEPVRAKAAWWKVEDEARAVGHAILVAFAQTERLFHRALEQEPAHHGAREALADLYHGRFRDTEGEDGAGFRYYEELVRTYHDGKYARELAGDGTLAVETIPQGAEVHLHR